MRPFSDISSIGGLGLPCWIALLAVSVVPSSVLSERIHPGMSSLGGVWAVGVEEGAGELVEVTTLVWVVVPGVVGVEILGVGGTTWDSSLVTLSMRSWSWALRSVMVLAVSSSMAWDEVVGAKSQRAPSRPVRKEMDRTLVTPFEDRRKRDKSKSLLPLGVAFGE